MSIKLQPSYETETFVSDVGYYVIKQLSEYGDESIVLISMSQLPELIADMQRTISSNVVVVHENPKDQ